MKFSVLLSCSKKFLYIASTFFLNANTSDRRKILQEFYDFVKKEAANNPDLLEALIDVGGVIMDKATLDNILPYLFFGVRSEL